MARQQLILDRYRIKRKAGAGGYATVYQAYDPTLKRDVAIKVIELSEADVARARLVAMEARLREEFDGYDEGAEDTADDSALDPDAIPEDDLFDHIPGLQEARMVVKLPDENIVTVYDCVLRGNTAYIIMEYVEGKTLAQIMDESGDRMTLDVIAAVFSSVAHALDVAHGSEMLHLDIKPDNVIINKKGIVKVTDFGLATLTDASGQGTAGGGTIGYMPLEQMRQQPLDARTDEWALASLTYEMISGDNPFFASDLDAAEAAIEDAELVLPSLCWDELDSGIDDVMFNALDLNPGDRYPSVAEFAEELAPYLGDAKKGKKQLADIVRGVEPVGEPEEELAPPAPSVPLVERLSDRGLAVTARLAAAAGVAFLAAFALVNIHIAEGSAWGLASDSTVAFGGLLLAAVLAAVVKPHVGTFAALLMLSASLLANGAYALGVAVLVVSGAWWWLIGRKDDAQPCIVLLQPLLGAVGFAAVSPVLAGCCLTVGRAAASAAFAAFLATVFASFGSCDLMGWNVVVNGHFSGMDVQAVFLSVITMPQTWCAAASWVLAAVVASLFCVRGTKAFDVAGLCAATAVLIAGAVVGVGLGSGAIGIGAEVGGIGGPGPNSAGSWLPSVSALIGSLFPGVLGIAVAALGLADRARWEEEGAEFAEGAEDLA